MNKLIRRCLQWVVDVWDNFIHWINPPRQPLSTPPRLPDHEYEWLFKQLLAGVGKGWTRDKVIRWLRRYEYRVTESRWLEWLPRFEDIATQDKEVRQQLLQLAQLGCGQISQAAGQLIGGAQEREKKKEEEEEIQPPTKNSDEEEEEIQPPTKNSDAKEWFKDGVQRALNGDFHGAIASWNRAVEIKPDDHYAWNNRGSALLYLGEYQQAIASFDRAVEIKPDSHEAWVNRGNVLDILGESQQAIVSYDRAVEIKPDFHDAWYNRGLALANLGEYQQAFASYDRAVEIKPDYHEAWYNRGLALGNLGEYQQALASYDRSLEIKPDYHEAWNNRGLALRNLGEYQQAIESFDRSLEIKPDHHQAWANRGAILCDCLGEYQQAIESYDRALEIKPDLHQAWANRGVALFHLGDYQQAIESFDRALEIKPDNHLAWANRGIASGKLIHNAPFIVPDADAVRLSELLQNPALNLRGYPGQIASYQEGLKQCPKETHPQGWGFLHHVIGKARFLQGQLATCSAETTTDEWGHRQTACYFYGQAANSYRQALTTIAAESKDIELHLEIVEDLIKALLELGENSEARQWHKKGFGILQGLVNQAYRTQLNIPVGAMPPCLPPSVKRLKLKFALYYRFAFDFAALDKDWSQALAAAELEKNLHLIWLLSATTEPIDISPTFAQMQTLVSETTALVYWYYSSHSAIAFLLTADNLTAISFSLPELESFISDWNRDYQIYSEKKSDSPTPPKLEGQRGTSENSQIWSQKLSAYLPRLQTLLKITEITSAIPSEITQLILIPHRDLHRLPLEALFANQWQKDIAMTRLPSAAFGLKIFQTREPGLKVSLSQEDLEGFNLLTIASLDSATDLPFTELEGAAIAQLFGNSNQKQPPTNRLLADTAASETAVKSALAAAYQIFHFSGHAAYNQKQPNLSALFLSGLDRLTGQEIASLSLKTYFLAYLNACETGITDIETIDTEYVGLVSAFLRAGVSQAISSLWPVNDESSTLLAIKFYEEYLAGEPATVALAKAKTWLREEATWGEIARIYQQCWDNAADDCQRSIIEKALFASRGKNPDRIPFQDAYYWSGVVISGMV